MYFAEKNVMSLYTNIPNEQGIRAVARNMHKHKPPYCHPRAASVIMLLREEMQWQRLPSSS